MRIGRLTILGVLAVSWAGAAVAQEQVETTKARPERKSVVRAVSSAELLRAGTEPNNWLMFGRDYTNQRWSPLSQINSTNVQDLQVSWMYQTGIARLATFETSPVVVDGMMYLTTPYNTAMAVDARTGHEVWRYEHKLGTAIVCCGPANRGVAVSDSLVYMATLDAQLVALNAHTGKEVWTADVAPPEDGYSETLAPLVVDDKVIVGISGAEYGIRGFVKAFNKNDGKLMWTFYTIPSPEEGGWWGKWAPATNEGNNLHRDIAKEKADSARHADAWRTGGGSVWNTPTYDPDTKTLYFAVGNPSPDLDGSVRPGDNLFTESIVAIDVTNGKYKWHYQQIPHDVWDLDATSPTVLVKLKDGRKAIAQAGKSAWVYVLDAGTGKLIRKSANFNRQENLFAQPTAQGVRMLPGANGGSEWSPAAVNPTLGYMYVLGLEQPMNYVARSAPLEKGKLWLGSAFKAIPGERQFGTFSAIDLNTGRIAWNVETEQPMIGGALATAGNLVFTGEGNGNFNAYDARTGRKLWTFRAGAGCNAPPVSYSLDGTQFIAVACGGNFQLGYPLGNSVLAFSLRGRGAAGR